MWTEAILRESWFEPAGDGDSECLSLPQQAAAVGTHQLIQLLSFRFGDLTLAIFRQQFAQLLLLRGLELGVAHSQDLLIGEKFDRRFCSGPIDPFDENFVEGAIGARGDRAGTLHEIVGKL